MIIEKLKEPSVYIVKVLSNERGYSMEEKPINYYIEKYIGDEPVKLNHRFSEDEFKLIFYCVEKACGRWGGIVSYKNAEEVSKRLKELL